MMGHEITSICYKRSFTVINEAQAGVLGVGIIYGTIVHIALPTFLEFYMQMVVRPLPVANVNAAPLESIQAAPLHVVLP